MHNYRKNMDDAAKLRGSKLNRKQAYVTYTPSLEQRCDDALSRLWAGFLRNFGF